MARTSGGPPIGSGSARSGRSPRVHVVGGADVAAELDAERAIRQAVETVASI